MSKSGPNRQVHSKPWYQYIILYPFFLLFRIWQWSIRLEVTDEDRLKITAENSPQILLFWHCFLFSGPMVQRYLRKNHPIYALISASKDGAWLVAVFNLLGVKSIRGSGNFRGAQSLKDMIRVIRAGSDIGITPDGSKGPAYVLKPGAAAVAKACKCKLTLFGVEHSSAWRLNSWDRLFLPKPFSKMRIRIESIESFEVLGEPDIEKASRILEKKLMKLQSPDPLITTHSD
jgi:lysophospholipid acyltransferase (LPLAT)-like uncharacterized protein